MLTYLKRMKGMKDHSKGRLINIIICSMQLITPILTLVAMLLILTQETYLSFIIKDYVTIGFILTIDNMFAAQLPV